MTIKELMYECKIQLVKGNGDKEIWISRDDEGNGFHQLIYTFNDKKEDIDYYDFDFEPENKENIILLG